MVLNNGMKVACIWWLVGFWSKSKEVQDCHQNRLWLVRMPHKQRSNKSA